MILMLRLLGGKVQERWSIGGIAIGFRLQDGDGFLPLVLPSHLKGERDIQAGLIRVISNLALVVRDAFIEVAGIESNEAVCAPKIGLVGVNGFFFVELL